MKTLCLIIGLCLISTLAYAEDIFSVKAGYQYVDCFAIDSGYQFSMAYEYKNKRLGCELGVDADAHKIRSVGRTVSLTPYVLLKFYPWEDIYFGAGLGYTYNSFIEEYEGEADIDDEISYRFVVGHWINDKVFVELFGTIEDIDIETGIPYETPIEQHSRKDSVGVRIGWRF